MTVSAKAEPASKLCKTRQKMLPEKDAQGLRSGKSSTHSGRQAARKNAGPRQHARSESPLRCTC